MISPSVAKAVSAIAGVTLSTGLISYKLGSNQPGLHAAIAFLISTVVALVWVALQEGPSHIEQTIRALVTGGQHTAILGTTINMYNNKLNKKVQGALSANVSSRVVVLLMPNMLHPSGSSNDAERIQGAIKSVTTEVHQNKGVCREHMWHAAVVEFCELIDQFVQARERQKTPYYLPLLAVYKQEAYNKPVETLSVERRNNIPTPHTRRNLLFQNDLLLPRYIKLQMAMLDGTKANWVGPVEDAKTNSVWHVSLS